MYKKNDLVKHTKFGIGKVLEITKERANVKAKIFFIENGEKTILANPDFLTLLDDEEMEKFSQTSDFGFLENIDDKNDNKAYQNISHAIEGFKKMLNTDDFNGAFYLSDERNYKLAFHENGKKLFGYEALQELLETQNAQQLKNNYKKFFASSHEGVTQNLTHYLEPLKLYDALDSDEKALTFFTALSDVLYGEDAFNIRFGRWVDALSELENAKWTLATIFLFIIHPDKYMYVKPETTKNALAISGFHANYTSTPTYAYYEKVLECSKYIFTKTKELGLNPKDMIDVQSFMWCIRPEYDNNGRAQEEN